MKITLILFCFISVAIVSKAQSDYTQALGLKFPEGLAISYKKFVTNKNYIEADAILWEKGFKAVGLYEFNFPIDAVEGLHWFVGPGAHIGFWRSDYIKNANSSIDLGIDGIIGFDYKFKNYPLNISLDWQPSIVLLGNNGLAPSNGGLGIRYTF